MVTPMRHKQIKSSNIRFFFYFLSIIRYVILCTYSLLTKKYIRAMIRELEQHDKVAEGWRTEEEMAAEAKLFREDWRTHFS